MTDETRSTGEIVVHLVGNVGPRRTEYGEPIESLFGLAHQKIKEGDISFCHLERIFTTGGCLQYRETNTWDSRVDPENVKSLAFAGFNVVSHAGNNCFDYGPDALVDSIDVLRRHGMQVIGAGKDIAEARKPAIQERKGVRVGFLGYNSVLPVEYEAREGKPGCAPMRVSTYYEAQGYQPGTPPRIITVAREDDLLALEDDIRKLRKEVDAVVVSIHWGQNFIPELIAEYQPVVGRRAIESGADVIVGHHSHTMRGIEVYKGRPIFYGIGSFGQEVTPPVKPRPGGAIVEDVPRVYRDWKTEPGWERNPGPKDRRYTMMVKCNVSKKGLYRVTFLPGYTNQRAEPECLSRNDPRFQEVVGFMEPLCRKLGTTLGAEGDEVVVCNSAGS
ncbi:MAG: CapA family protein [Chloroflexi bacterium]|nr:CapA family protein [Chloroflexota bacterium]